MILSEPTSLDSKKGSFVHHNTYSKTNVQNHGIHAPDILLQNYRHLLSGHIFQGCMSCNDHCVHCEAPLGSEVASQCWNGMSRDHLVRRCHPWSGSARTSLLCRREHRSLLLPGTDPGKAMPVRSPMVGARILLLTSRCPQERAGENKGGQTRAEQWPFLAAPPQAASQPALPCRAPFQAGSAHSSLGMSPHVYADANVGRQAGELAFLMNPDNRARAEVTAITCCGFSEKEEGKDPGSRAEGTDFCRTQKNLVIIIIKITVTESVEQTKLYNYFSTG